nr:hypothetical protein [Planctomycetota bacterium]
MLVGYHTGGMRGDLPQVASELRTAGYAGIQLAGPVLAGIADADGWDAVPGILGANSLAPICMNVAMPDLEVWLEAESGGEPAALARLRHSAA